MFVQSWRGVMSMSGVLFLIFNAYLSGIEINEARMRQASRDLTAEESKAIKLYLYDTIEQSKQDILSDPRGAKAAKLSQMEGEFHRGRYDLVLQEIAALGDDPQSILDTSKLRTYMLSGKLEHTPWFLREIAGLDWFFEYDSKRSSRNRKWPKPQDKLVYIMSLADELAMNHKKVFDATLVLDAIDSLEKHIDRWLQYTSKSFRPRVDGTREKLSTLRAEYKRDEEQ